MTRVLWERPTLTFVGFVLFNVLLWATHAFWDLLLVPWLIALWVLAKRLRRWEVPWIVLTSPFLVVSVISFATGTARYFQGNATILEHGLLEGDFQTSGFYRNSNPDRGTGLPVVTTGCFYYGYEVFESAPRNLAARLWTGLLGRSANAWNGPYPTFDEGFQRLNQAPNLDLDALKSVVRDDGLYRDLKTNLVLFAEVRVAHLNEHVVLVSGVQRIMKPSSILLVDLENKRIVAGLASPSGEFEFASPTGTW